MNTIQVAITYLLKFRRFIHFSQFHINQNFEVRQHFNYPMTPVSKYIIINTTL